MEFNINELMAALETTDRDTLLKAFKEALDSAVSLNKSQEKKEDAVEMFCAITKYLHRWHPELGDMTMNDRDIDMAMEFIDNMAPDMAKLMKPLNVKVDPIKDFLTHLVWHNLPRFFPLVKNVSRAGFLFEKLAIRLEIAV